MHYWSTIERPQADLKYLMNTHKSDIGTISTFNRLREWVSISIYCHQVNIKIPNPVVWRRANILFFLLCDTQIDGKLFFNGMTHKQEHNINSSNNLSYLLALLRGLILCHFFYVLGYFFIHLKSKFIGTKISDRSRNRFQLLLLWAQFHHTLSFVWFMDNFKTNWKINSINVKNKQTENKSKLLFLSRVCVCVKSEKKTIT